jgi:UDP-3-O-[3-hydroxymyristoyl] glucosamine N-acyltransferase
VETTISELAALIGGQLADGIDGSYKISGTASLYEAGPTDVTFFAQPRYLPQFRATQAGAALVPLDFIEAVAPICIRCEKPSELFTRVVAHFAPPPLTFPVGIHPTAVIGKNVVLGEGVSLQAYVVIEDGARIGARTVIGAHGYVGQEAQVGEDCLLHPRVTISSRCTVGHRAILHSGVVIGADGFGFQFQEGRHVKIPQVGTVQIDDDVEIGANSAIDRARFGRTWIQSGTKIDNLVQIGHNVVIGKNSIICGQVGIAGSVKVGDRVTLAGQVGVNGHLEIGDRAIIGGQAGIAKSVPPMQIMMGTPAVPDKVWKKQVVQLSYIDSLRSRLAKMEKLLGNRENRLPPESEA